MAILHLVHGSGNLSLHAQVIILAFMCARVLPAACHLSFAIMKMRMWRCAGERPDVWFEPAEVWEIRGADLTISPVHKAAVGHVADGRGCSLRFPRFIQVQRCCHAFRFELAWLRH